MSGADDWAIAKLIHDHDPSTGVTVIRSAGPNKLTVTPAGQTRRIPLPLGGLLLHASTPPAVAAVATFPALDFATDADDVVFGCVRVPPDWDGVSDLAMKLFWTNEATDAVADTETVCWALDWRSKVAGELYDAGTVATDLVTYTQAGAGVDKDTHLSSIAIDHDDTNQPIAAGDLLGFMLYRDVSGDTYSGKARLLAAWIEYNSIEIVV